jgi:hypothetical protein
LGLPFPCDYARLIIGGGTTGNAPRDHSNARTDLPLLGVLRQGDVFAMGAAVSRIGSAADETGGWTASAIAGAAIGALTPAVFLLFDRGASRNG